MESPLSAHELFQKHLFPLLSACGFIGLFVITIPIIYMLSLSPQTELLLFASLFALCHLANWPIFRLRWQLWFQGRLTSYAAVCTTALLAGSFGIPFVLLASMLK